MPFDPILLDADGTLFDFRLAERRALERTLVRYGAPAGEEALALYRGINEGLWRRFEAGQITKDELLGARFTRFFERLGLRADGKKCNEEYLGHLAQGAELLPGALELCRALAPRARLILATNGVARVQKSRLRASALAPYISGIFVSEDVGVPKPDPRYFDAVLGALGVRDRSRCVMLGDSLTSDMAGACAAGVRACWFCPDRDAPGPQGGVTVDWRISSLSEFVPIALEY